MKTIIDGRKHEVVYIEYVGNIPHDVKTIFWVDKAENGGYWRLVHWDFFKNNGDKGDIRHYESGSGGDYHNIDAPQWVDGFIGKFWADKKVALKGEVKNGKKLKNPKVLLDYFGKKSMNPFKVSEETHSYDFCEKCGFDSTETCWEHKYEDEDGDLRYHDTDEVCN